MLADFSRWCCPTLYNRAPWKELILSILTLLCVGVRGLYRDAAAPCTKNCQLLCTCCSRQEAAWPCVGDRNATRVAHCQTARSLYHTVCAVERTIVSGQPESLLQTIGPRAHQWHNHDTRRAELFTLPSIRVEAGRRRVCYRGVSLMNDMNVEPGIPAFRAEVKQLAKSL